MSANNPFQQSASKAFLVNLATSTLDSFYKQHAQQQAEDRQAKETDFALLMNALETLKPNLTPSQVSEVMTRAVDIFKPKGHTGVKERITELFGGGQPYQMQSAGIIGQATSKPRLQVQGADQPQAGSLNVPSGYGPDISLPRPPTMMHPEKTNREQEIFDKEQQLRLQGNIVADRQRENDVRDAAARQADIRLRSAETLRRFSITQPAREQGRAFAKLKERASIFGDPEDPVNLERARVQLQGEYEAGLEKKRNDATLAGIRARREDEKIDAYIASVGSLINSRAGNAGLQAFKAGLDVLKERINVVETMKMQLLREQSNAIANADDAGIKAASDKLASVQTELNDLNVQLQSAAAEAVRQSQPVTLPTAPGKSSGPSRRGGVKLTEKEIRENGGSDADVAEARSKGVLAQ